MKTKEYKKEQSRQKRALRVRKNLRGNGITPRLCVVKTNVHLEAQLIDDEKGVTIASISSKAKEFKNSEYGKKNRQTAKHFGEILAKDAMGKNIKEVIFDRGRHKFHGVIQEFADAARSAGLKF